MFISTAAVFLILIVASRPLEKNFEYELNQFVPDGDSYASISSPQHYGSYGFYLAKTSEGPGKHLRIFLLGNSVYQECGIVERMQQLANAEHRNADFYNLAQTGSSICDYMVQFAKVVKQKPDLVVIAFVNLAFAPKFHNEVSSMPRFRTDCDQMLFQREIWEQLPFEFYTQELSLDEACSNAASALIPIRRIDQVARARLYNWLDERQQLPLWVAMQFPGPTLNVALDWRKAAPQQTPDARQASPAYPETDFLLRCIVECAKKNNVPILFIRQESSDDFATPDVMPNILAASKLYNKAYSVDFRSKYDASRFIDGVHPRFGLPEYVNRHYRAIFACYEIIQKGHL